METTQCALLNQISEYQFVCVELNLYLDYLCYSKMLQQLITQYEEQYGPLQNFGHSPTETGCYVCSKWPWE